MRRERYNIRSGIRRGEHEMYWNVHNHEPLRPGAAQRVFADTILSVLGNVTRGFRHDFDAFMTDDLFIATSDTILLIITKEKVK